MNNNNPYNPDTYQFLGFEDFFMLYSAIGDLDEPNESQLANALELAYRPTDTNFIKYNIGWNRACDVYNRPELKRIS